MVISFKGQAGEIWELNLPSDSVDLGENRCVMIVREPQPEYPAILSLMLFSPKTQYVSDIDILITPSISGLDRDMLAETWNVQSFSTGLLSHQVGKRLSRQLYDLLLSIGDRQDRRSTKVPLVRRVGSSGLAMTPRSNLEFHQREKIWFHSLSPVSILDAANLMEKTIAIEREFIDLARIRTSLSQWFQQIIAPEWEELNNVPRRMEIPTRSDITDEDPIDTINQIKSLDDEVHRRQLIKKLGYLAEGCNDAIQTLMQIIDSTQDQETLWVAVDSLAQIAPEHPHGRIRRSISIALGRTVEFVVNIIPRFDRRADNTSPKRFAILFQVYPDLAADVYLPANLKLIVRDESGNDLTAIVARSIDRCIQLKLSGIQTEIFSVCLELDGVESVLNFEI